MKFLGHALVLALGLPRAAESATLQSSGDCAVPLTKPQCQAAADTLEARWIPQDMRVDVDHIPGGCFAKVSAGGDAKKLRWNKHKAAGDGCDPRRPCVCGPPCEPDADLAARYGPQLCPDEVEALFDQTDGTGIQIEGLPHFLQPTYSTPLSDSFATHGLVEMTFEDAVSVCVTKCADNPGCDAVNVFETMADSVDPYTGKPDFQCVMVNTDLDGDAYLLSYPQGVPCSCVTKSVTYTKKTGTPPPSFDEVVCDINGDPDMIGAAIYCTLGNCYPWAPALLTRDWNETVVPGIQCVVESGKSVLDCVNCITNRSSTYVHDVCRKTANDNTTIFREPNLCGDVCAGTMCADLLETTMLCIMGSEHYGVITGPNFTCPDMDVE